MKRKKLLGILLIVTAVILLGYALYLQFFATKKAEDKEIPKQNKVVQQEEPQLEKQSEQEPEQAKEEPEQEYSKAPSEDEVDYPDETSELDAMPCELTGMIEEVKGQILNSEAFLQAAKNWMLERGYYGKNILALNEISYQYETKKKRYLLMAEGENDYFYVVEDLNTQVYTTEDFLNY